MSLSFLPKDIENALSHLNLNYVTEIRLRKSQPVVIQYKGEYKCLGKTGLSQNAQDRLAVNEITPLINAATGGCIYNFTEQMKSGFITVEHGVRIGIAGEYVTESGKVNTIKNATSLNIRIPHNVIGCAQPVCEKLFAPNAKSTLFFSKPGLGKTTMLRDVARFLGADGRVNVLVFDERNEIAALDGYGNGFNLGVGVDVVRCYDKLNAIGSAIRAMKPDVIITDELYGSDDIKAVKYAADCGIAVIASSHVTDGNILKSMPFEYFVKLTKVGAAPEIYDKNFNPYCDNRVDNFGGSISFGE